MTTGSMSEQLAPLASKLKAGMAIARPVSQVVFELGGKNPESVFVQTRKEVLEWMANRAGRPLPKHAWSGESFELEEVGAQRVAATAIDDPRYWAARLDDADKTVPQRVWVTEIGLRLYPTGLLLFGCRLICVSRGADVPFDRSIPGFVRQVAQKGLSRLEGRPIGQQPRVVADEAGVMELVELLDNPARRCDVIVLALPENSTDPADTAIPATEVHLRTLGAAHVFILTGPASFHLTDQVGKEFSVFRGAVRSYLPGFNPGLDQPFAHPLGLPHRIVNWPGGGSGAYMNFLISQTLGRSVSRGDLEESVPSFSTIRNLAARLERKKARSIGSSDRELLSMAEEEIERLTKALDQQKSDYDALFEDAKQERDETRQQADEAKARTISLRYRVEGLERKLAQREAEETDIPDDLEDFKEWCESNLAGSVEVHNRAVQAAKKCEIEDIELIYESLLLLRDYYVPMRRYGGDARKQAYERRCRELGLEESPSFAGTGHGEQGDTYIVKYDGKKKVLDRHLKKGNSREPRYCFRLYFFWDEENEQVVVGWLPSHLDTRAT